MNTVNAILSENPDFKIVTVKFDPLDNKTYHYKTFFDVQAGDQVVVDSPSSGLVVVEVVSTMHVTEFEGRYQLKWLVSGSIDVEHYEALKSMERKVVSTVNKLKYEKDRKEFMANLQDKIGEEGVEQVKGLVRL